METFSLAFIGWFYTLVCAVVIGAGGAVLLFLHSTGRLVTRYKGYSTWNDVMLLVIWGIGLAGGVGVLGFSYWGHFLLQLFCFMLMALVVTSGATRLYTLYKLRAKMNISSRDIKLAVMGIVLMVGPVVLFCIGTVLSLRTEEARRAFGIS